MSVAVPEPPEAGALDIGETVLSVQGVSKRFGGTQALDDASLDLERGKVLALLGENGAGKSTLIKILAGVHAPDEGTILFRGVKTSPAHLPIAFIH
jgi:ribose transport system ATP-binding protein